MPLIRCATTALLLVATVAGSGCERAPTQAPTPTEPVQAVTQLLEDLRRNDFIAYAHHSVPPALHARLDQAWNEGRTRWPLTELPLDGRLPAFFSALAAPGAEKQLLTTYNRQFSGAGAELRSAVSTLGLFAGQYLRKEGDYSADERAHYAQLVAALSRWGQQAPLGDAQRARRTIPQLVAAARQSGLAGGPGTFRQLGMQRSLERFGPFFGRFKQVLSAYGLDIDADLAGAKATLIEEDGEHAKVRLNYTLAGHRIEAQLAVERHEGHWYLSDALRHAQTQAAAPAPAPIDPAPTR